MKRLIFISILMWSLLIQAATYYVSNTGNDANNGTTTGTPWLTISRVNAATINPGDFVLFQAGGTWREELQARQGNSTNSVTYGRYGTGANPRIVGSTRAITWTATGTTNVWVSATNIAANPNAANGYMSGGAIFFESTGQNTHWGRYRTYSSNYSNLVQEYDWTWNAGVLYVYAPTDPDTRYSAIEANQRSYCIVGTNNASSYITINGIDMLYSKGAGWRNGYPEEYNQTDLVFRNCTIGYIGIKGSSQAYGIEAFHSNFLVENCFFSDCGRRAISFNFYLGHTPVITISNIIVRNNTFKRGQHTTSLDLAWIDDDGVDVSNLYFYNNIVDDSEIAWDGIDQLSNQFYLEAQGNNLSNVYVVNNVFIGTTARSILISGGQNIRIWNNTIYGRNVNTTYNPYALISLRNANTGGLTGIDYRNNILVNNTSLAGLEDNGLMIEFQTTTVTNLDYNLYWQTSSATNKNIIGGWFGWYNINEWATYRASQSPWDSHSPTPANPNFVDAGAHNFNLGVTSTARNAGVVLPYVIITDADGVVDTINKYDIAGTLRSTVNPSIGAYDVQSTNNTTAEIVSFTIPNQESSVVNQSANTVVVTVPYGTNRASLTPSIVLTDFATINPTSGTARNFTNPITYTVTSGSGTVTQVYTVTVVNGPYCNTAPPIQLNAVVTPDTNDYGNGTITLTPSAGLAPYSYLWNTGATTNAIVNLDAGNYSVVVTDGNSCTANGSFAVPQIDTRIIDSILIDIGESWMTIPSPWIAVNATNTAYYSGTVRIIGTFSAFNSYGEAPVAKWPDNVVLGYGNSSSNNNYLYITHLPTDMVYDVEVMSNRTLSEVRNQYTVVNGVSRTIDVGDMANSIAYFEDIAPRNDSIIIVTTPITSTFSYINAVKVYIKTGASAPNTATDITSFNIAGQVNTIVNPTNHTVSVIMPYNTNRASLTPTIGLSNGATINPASGTARNFTNPVTYTVTAQDGTTQQVWTVTVTNASVNNTTDIVAVTVPGQTSPAVINNINHTVTVNVGYFADVTNLAPSISLSTGASINPASGTARNFTNPVTYTVTAQDGTTQQVWTVTITRKTRPVKATFNGKMVITD